MTEGFATALVVAIIAGLATLITTVVASRGEHRGLKRIVLLNEAINGIEHRPTRSHLEAARTELISVVSASLLAEPRTQRIGRVGMGWMFFGFAVLILSLIYINASPLRSPKDDVRALTFAILFLGGLLAMAGGEIAVAWAYFRARKLKRAKAVERATRRKSKKTKLPPVATRSI